MVQLENVDVSDERVDLGGGVSVPASWTVVLREEPDVPGSIHVRVVYEPKLERTVAAEVRVIRDGEGDEITSLTLREVRVQYALQVSGILVSTVSEPGYDVVTGAGYIQRMRERTKGDLAASVAGASTIYRLASAINLPPLKAVSDGLGVSQSTATRLMSRARSEGFDVGAYVPHPSATGPVVGSPIANGPGLGR